MSATIIALALFGCTDDGSSCRRIETEQTATYETQAACTAQLDAAAMSEDAMSADYPTVYAQCMPSGTLAAIGDRPVNINNIQLRFAAR
jgi:hypothetical protein